FGQLAAMVQPAKRLALEKRLLRWVLLVVRVKRCPSAGRRGHLYRDARLVEHIEWVGHLGEEEAGLAIVRTDHGCIGDDEQDMLGHDGSSLNDVVRDAGTGALVTTAVAAMFVSQGRA